VNQYGTKVTIFVDNEKIGDIWLYGDGSSLNEVIDRLNKVCDKAYKAGFENGLGAIPF
jgi:hypothetical protein